MDVESRLNLSLDDIIKGTKDTAKPKKKPKQISKAKVKLVRSAQPVAQGAKTGAGMKQGRQNGRQALAVQKKGMKMKSPATKRAVVTVVNGKARANTRRVVTNRAQVPNVAVTIKNNQAARQVQRPAQPQRAQARPSGLASQAARQQAAPAYGYGPRNLLPRDDPGAIGTAAPASQHRGDANSDYGVSRRMLGGALAGRVRVAAQRRSSGFVDYDNTKTGLRMDYGR